MNSKAATALPQTLQSCYDRMLRAETAHTAPDARRELAESRQVLHAALVALARLTRVAIALRERAGREKTGFAALDAEHAESRRVNALDYALCVARDCDHARAMWDNCLVKNDNGVIS